MSSSVPSSITTCRGRGHVPRWRFWQVGGPTTGLRRPAPARLEDEPSDGVSSSSTTSMRPLGTAGPGRASRSSCAAGGARPPCCGPAGAAPAGIHSPAMRSPTSASVTPRPARRGAWPRRIGRRPDGAGPGDGWTSRSPGAALVARGPRARPQLGALPPPIPTLDDHLAAGLRVDALARARRRVRAAGRRRRRRARRRRPRLRAADPAAAVAARLLRVRGARRGRCGSAAAARSPRPGIGCRSSTSATSRRSAVRTTRSGRRRRRTSSTTSSRSRRSIDTPARDLAPERAEEAIGGYTILNDWSARDLQREETTVRLGPAKGKDFATSFGPWLVTPDELADVRAPGDRLRPGDDRGRSTAIGRAAAAGPTRTSRSARCSRAHRPTSGSGPAT